MSKQEAKGSTLAVTYFTLQGVGTLISCNAIFNGLDYFAARFTDNDVFTLLPMALNFGQLLSNFFLPKLLAKFSLERRVLIPLFFAAAILIGLPVVANILQGTTFGFLVNLFLLFTLGTLSNTYQGSISGLASAFPFKFTSYFLVGTGLSGLVMNALRAFAIISFANLQNGPLVGIIVYFTAAGLILIGCMLIHPVFMKSDFCKAYVTEPSEAEPLMNDSECYQNSKPEKLEANFTTVISVFGEVKFFVLTLCLNYILSFISFPGIMSEKPIPSMTNDWKLVSMLATFNVFDVVGKNLAQYRSKYTKWTILGIVVSRVIYDILFVLQAIPTSNAVLNAGWFGFLNIALFGLTNGFVTTALFIMGPEVVDGPKKELAGFLSIFGLVTGLTAGGLVALPINKYIKSKNSPTLFIQN